MLPHQFDKIINRVHGITVDTGFIVWSKDELINFIDEGQEEYCKRTHTLRAESALLTRENSDIYNLPKDCHIVDRIERDDGYTITKTSSRDLERMFGRNFRSHSGTPQYYYQDLDGQGQLRFYPKASEDIRASFVPFDADLGGIISSEDDEEVAETYDSEFGEVIATDEDLDDDTDQFDSDLGVVTGVIDTANKFRVFYIKLPRLGYLEISDVQALQYYCLHKCYEKDTAFQDLQKSNYYEIKFNNRVMEESGRVHSAYHANLNVRGTYA